MAYVIAEPCIDTKDNSCVEVCPVDCIHPTPDEPDYDQVKQLYIDPEECIDCDACVEACPVDACFAEDQLPDEWQQYIQINSDYYKQATKPAARARLLRHGQGRAGDLRNRRPGGRLEHAQLLRGGGDDPARGVVERLCGRRVRVL
jgi:ferredoxin